MIPIQHFEFDGYAFEIKEVKISGNSGRVFVPKTWEGRQVVVILLQPPAIKDELGSGIMIDGDKIGICPNCNNKVLTSSNYCQYCGKRLINEEPEILDNLSNQKKVNIKEERR